MQTVGTTGLPVRCVNLGQQLFRKLQSPLCQKENNILFTLGITAMTVWRPSVVGKWTSIIWMPDSFSKTVSDVSPPAFPCARFLSVVLRQKAKKETKIWSSILFSHCCHMGRMESDLFKSFKIPAQYAPKVDTIPRWFQRINQGF